MSKYYTFVERTDGFGAQFQTIICSIIIVESDKQIYVHTPIKSMEHNYDNNPEFLNKVEETMNVKNHYYTDEHNIKVNILPFSIINIFENNIDVYVESASMFKLKQIFRENKQNPYNTEYTNIAVHIRRPNIHDNRINGADTKDEYYINIINTIRKQHHNDKLLFHIYSQGDSVEFEKKYTGDDMVFHINECLFKSFTGLVFADIFVTSASSFSYSAALLSNGIIYFQSFWHKPYKNWIVLHSK